MVVKIAISDALMQAVHAPDNLDINWRGWQIISVARYHCEFQTRRPLVWDSI